MRDFTAFLGEVGEFHLHDIPLPMVSPTRWVAMAEPRVQAYLSVIQELLDCPDEVGEE